jgi:type IV pilus assembly protein PilQ
MLTSRLIRLRHVPAGGLVERMPDALRIGATHQLVQEQNALLVTAPADLVAATEAYLGELDRPTEQILLEVIVVEFETSGLRKLGVTFLGGLLPEDASLPESEAAGWSTYLFGGGSDQRGGLDVIGDGTALNDAVNFWSDLLGIRSIGQLPTDFFFRLQALEHAGKAEIRSRPHIATLNGHTASISVGTSQYYILKSLVPYTTGGVFGQGEAEHFEYVQADVRLEIRPWVTEDGGVTATISPSFTTPVGAFDPRIPPTLHNWNVDTSVRLEDGETFMVGGLIQEQERVLENRVPFLGSLPLIGRLFRNTHREKRTSELVIFITPHILRGEGYGGGVINGGTPDVLHERLAPNGSGRVSPPVPGRSW